MLNKHHAPMKTSWGKKKIAGGIIFVIGIGVLVPCRIIFLAKTQHHIEPEGLGVVLALIVVMVICSVLALVGLILFIVGWNEGRIRASEREADDLQSDYNDNNDVE